MRSLPHISEQPTSVTGTMCTTKNKHPTCTVPRNLTGNPGRPNSWNVRRTVLCRRQQQQQRQLDGGAEDLQKKGKTGTSAGYTRLTCTLRKTNTLGQGALWIPALTDGTLRAGNNRHCFCSQPDKMLSSLWLALHTQNLLQLC